jgi:hypothetical protein
LRQRIEALRYTFALTAARVLAQPPSLMPLHDRATDLLNHAVYRRSEQRIPLERDQV